MLQDFLNIHRDELIRRCRQKAAERCAPSDTHEAMERGVPLFLLQLADTLAAEHSVSAHDVFVPSVMHSSPEIGQVAALRGAEMLRRGFTIDQVVHEYGDVCQAVTELAIETKAPISNDEFRILNRSLDNAIADAVVSFGAAREDQTRGRAESLHSCLESFAQHHRQLVETAMEAYSAIKTGRVGLTGATGSLLWHKLTELHYLVEHSLPEIRLASAMTTLVPD